jgi:hypothetical protein
MAAWMAALTPARGEPVCGRPPFGSIGQLTRRKKPVTPADFRNVVPAVAVAPMGGQSGAEHADRFRQIIRTLPKMRSVAHGRP